ncbi:HotDog domain-containing protein [Nemania sp. FL0916]|nr:HotDog domain-containing protein [Nemania sp. FL0916]
MAAKRMDDVSRAHFAAIPWCARHIEGDRVTARTAPSRTPKATGEDCLFGKTLKSDSTIIHMLQVYEEPLAADGHIGEVKAFLSLGRGLNGYPDICHGGLVMTILDEIIGMLVPINQERKRLPAGPCMTAYLNTTFLKPVPTPSIILTRARFTKIEGRKYFAQGTIEGEDGVVLARADALFIHLKSSL